MNRDAASPAEAYVAAVADLTRLATAGFGVSLHLRMQVPLYIVQTYPLEWLRTYNDEGLMFRDPRAAWGLTGTGWIDWEDLRPLDRDGIIARAGGHGMRHGLVAATVRHGSRSVGSFARGDRPFERSEAEGIDAALQRLHDATHPDSDLDDAQRAVLERLSAAFAGG